MSQIPSFQRQKNVTCSTSRTSRIPGTNTTVTQTETRVTEVADCMTGPSPRGSASGRPRGQGLRPPSGLPGASFRSTASITSGLPGSCGSPSCATSTPRVPPTSDVPQIRIHSPAVGGPGHAKPRESSPQSRTPQGVSLLRPPDVLPQHTQTQSPSYRGLPQPRSQGLPQPRPTQGIPRPGQGLLQHRSTQGVSRPQGLPQPRPTQGLSRPTQGFQQPVFRGSPQARPCQSQSQTRSSQGLSGSRLSVPQPHPQTAPQRSMSPCAARPVVRTPESRGMMSTAPGAPQRRTKRPTGPEAYKVFDFERVNKLKKPTTSIVFPERKTRGQRPKPANRIEETVHDQLMERSSVTSGKVTAKSGRISYAGPEYMQTPAGRQQILQKTTLERRVERDEGGERIVKNLEIRDSENVGRELVEMGIQQLDPNFARDEGREVIGITSTVSITEDYATVTKQVSRAVTETVPDGAHMAPEEVARLVAEETEDIENTLKMLPPELELSPGRHEMKQRLQNLRLNSESVALLEQAIINPEPNADEAQVEPSPEMMASMMNTVEKRVPPKSTPDQVFNSLFEGETNEHFIQLSAVTQGPLQDVVVPTEIAFNVHQEVLTSDMAKLTEKLQSTKTAEEIPYVDIFTRVMDDAKKSPTKGKTTEITYQLISDEQSLWVNANLERLVNVVGAQPAEILDPVNIDELEAEGNLEEQMGTGMEYFVDVDPIQYMSRVQLRGTDLPSYFPGYMVALPEFHDLVKVARSPDEVFASAWKAAQPKYFPDESSQSLIY